MTVKEKFGFIVWFWGLGSLILSNPSEFDFAFIVALFCAVLGTLLLGAKND